MRRARVAIIGSGNIGTDLMYKILRKSDALEMGAMAGVDRRSDGLVRAARMNIATTSEGIEGLVKTPLWESIEIVFDATSAAAHRHHDRVCREHHKRIIDLSPAAIGSYCVPVVNLDEILDQENVNMVSCGGQATIPIVRAVSSVSTRTPYAEIVASIASRSAGPGTRANIDEFTRTTARGIERIGLAERGKAIIILNPADPPILMRNTVYTFSVGADEAAIEASVDDMVRRVQRYVPGYRLKHRVQFERFAGKRSLTIPDVGALQGLKSTVLLEVEGAAHYLPAYAGNLDIMTSAALRTGEIIAERLTRAQP